MDVKDSKRVKNESLEVTGVSRSGRVRKKSSKLMDFESTDEVDNRHKRKSQPDKSEHSIPKPRKIPKISKPKLPEESDHFDNGNHENEDAFAPHDSDTDNDLYQPQIEEEDDDFDVDEDDDDDDYNEGQLVVDEKTPTQSLYMMEKSKKKLVIKDGKVVGTAKAQRKDKGKARYTAYMMWAKEIRQELSKQYPDMDFTTMARRLSELWGTVPNSERELWRRKAKREAAKKQKPKQEAPLMPSRKFINKKGGPIAPPLNNTPVSQPTKTLPTPPPAPAPEPQQQQLTPVKKPPEVITSPGLYKVTGIAPIDVAAHLKLLGESLFIIGERLQEHEGQIAVSGSLSVLLDSLLCAVGPLLCLTQQVEEMQSNGSKPVLTKILQNVAYMMPGLG